MVNKANTDNINTFFNFDSVTNEEPALAELDDFFGSEKKRKFEQEGTKQSKLKVAEDEHDFFEFDKETDFLH